jgi:hypothetical protein
MASGGTAADASSKEKPMQKRKSGSKHLEQMTGR